MGLPQVIQNPMQMLIPAMAAGVSATLRDMERIVGLADARAPAPKKRGPYKERQPENSN